MRLLTVLILLSASAALPADAPAPVIPAELRAQFWFVNANLEHLRAEFETSLTDKQRALRETSEQVQKQSDALDKQIREICKGSFTPDKAGGMICAPPESPRTTRK